MPIQPKPTAQVHSLSNTPSQQLQSKEKMVWDRQ